MITIIFLTEYTFTIKTFTFYLNIQTWRAVALYIIIKENLPDTSKNFIQHLH